MTNRPNGNPYSSFQLLDSSFSKHSFIDTFIDSFVLNQKK
jgi:hypothetical protein